MATDLIIKGPYKIPHTKAQASMKQINNEHKNAFWTKPEVVHVCKKQGCYVFALKAGKGFTPWYVGKATKSLMQEVLGTHQMNLYNKALFKGIKGTPVFFFIVPDGNKRKVPEKIISKIEKFLIHNAYYSNKDIVNTNLKKPDKWTIKGVVRGGKGKTAFGEKAFSKMMGL